MPQIFSAEQIVITRREFAKLDGVNPDNLKYFHAIFDRCNDEQIEQLSKAEIKFVSKLAANEVLRRKMRKQEDYRASMQSTLDFCV